MEAVLFYVEESRIPNQRRLIDSWCAMAGMTHIMVDKTGKLRKTNGNVFSTIQEAIDAFPDHVWVFLSEKTERVLSEFEHPKANVIYCVGSDDDGFQSLDLSGHLSFRLHSTHKKNNEWHASSVVPMVIADRMLRM